MTMSIGPLGTIGAAAATSAAQRQGSDVDRVAQDQSSQARETAASKQAAKAEGIGETEQDHEAFDRDADGRRVWERSTGKQKEHDPLQEDRTGQPRSRDATGDRGNQLDLSG